MKFNSLPTEPTNPRWFLYIISVYMEGKGYPSTLMAIQYFQTDAIAVDWMKAGSSAGLKFESDIWYKVMMTGKPIFGTTCEQILVIEGPGFKSYFPGVGYVDGKWRTSVRNDCLSWMKTTLSRFLQHEI